MKNKILSVSLFVFSSGSVGANVLYCESQIWTGGNLYSSAPAPSCPCDLDHNIPDCPSSFELERDQAGALGAACYDEFIPPGSGGWVHARSFELNQDAVQCKASE